MKRKLPKSCIKKAEIILIEEGSSRITSSATLPKGAKPMKSFYHRDEVSDLYNLQRLLVRGCHRLSSLPYSFAKLINMRHLDITDTPQLNKIPLWGSESKACKFLVSLKKLEVDRCEMLVSLGEKEGHLGISLASLKEVELYGCKKLEHYKCSNSIERLVIWNCGSMTSLTFPTMLDLSSNIKIIHIDGCENLEKSWLLNKFLSSLESLVVWRCDDMMSFPEGCFVYLTRLEIWNCDNIESIPDKGFGFLPLFCLKTLWIRRCKNLKSFPHEHLPSLTSLEELKINNCPSLDYSFPCGLWPPNLRNLRIGCLNKPMSEWGVQNFPSSLVELRLYGQNSGVVSFEDVRNTTPSSFLVPPSLTSLHIDCFEDLESVSTGLQHLTCLEKLATWSCPKLRDLPEKLLPSLSFLRVRNCRKLEKRCRGGTGKYWPIISQIPHLDV
ncbi:Leucine-rich repeat-containing protein [Cynara cardunculus var. scolymus]|uniref:Leucine-rich repeat-containing protein n=1 Tax=Cynara cardunculus var. scolymus TaxID=59895 RepID=A0A103Y6M1_CYNCS|nr:Leucine-rich repeat-containing protein [Cynara cardunculus var. scolymus]